MENYKLTVVSFELARKLTEVQFPQNIFNTGWYNKKGYKDGRTDLGPNGEDFGYYPTKEQKESMITGSYSAPSLELVKKWFREEHEIIIEPSFYDDPINYECDIWVKKLKWDLGTHCKNFESYEEALDAGLMVASQYLYKKINPDIGDL